MDVTMKTGIDWGFMLRIIGGFTILLGLLLYRHMTVRRYNKMLQNLNESINDKNQKLEEAAKLREMVEQIAKHDLKSPLNC